MSNRLLQSYIRDFKENKENLPWITLLLIAANVLIFLAVEIAGNTRSGNYMMQIGAMYPTNITEGKEYWRFLTSGFLHFGPEHLLNNMVILGAAGSILERAIGRIRYLILYLTAGIGGSILSCLQMVHSGDYAVSAGASGAVFGLIGGLLWVVIVHHGRYERLTGRGLLFMIALSLYYGVSSGGIDNWGHIGGLLTGIGMAILLYRRTTR